jgi:hypothetical protein
VTLVDRVQRAQSSLRVAIDDDQLRLVIGKLSDRASRIETSAETLEVAAVAAKELRSARQTLPLDVLHGLATLRSDIQVSREAIAKTSLFASGDDFYRMVLRISEDEKRVTNALTEQWRRYRAEVKIPQVDQDFLGLLEQAGLDVAGLSSTVESALAKISFLNSRALPRVGDVASLLGAVSDLEGAVEKLASLVQPAVGEFIVQASGAAGAGLDLFTDEIREFLIATGLTPRYRIRQGG